MISPPSRTCPAFTFSAAGFIAISTSGWSPAVSIAVEPKLIWNAETPKVVPCGAPDFRREIGEGREVVAGERGRERELAAGQLHAVAAVAGKADDDSFLRRTSGGFSFGNAMRGCGHEVDIRTIDGLSLRHCQHQLKGGSS